MNCYRAQMQVKAVFHPTTIMTQVEDTVRFPFSYCGMNWSITSRGVEYPLFLHKFKCSFIRDELDLYNFIIHEFHHWAYIMIGDLYVFCRNAAQEAMRRKATTLELKVDLVAAHFFEVVPGDDRVRGEVQFRRYHKGSDFYCSVCLHEAKEGQWLARMDCGHEFHDKCLSKWLEMSQNKDCPLCRSVVNSRCEVDDSTWLLNSSFRLFP